MRKSLILAVGTSACLAQAVLKIAAWRASAVVVSVRRFRSNAERVGIPRSQSAVVRNGVDVQEFHPDRLRGVETPIGIEASGLYVGFVGDLFPGIILTSCSTPSWCVAVDPPSTLHFDR